MADLTDKYVLRAVKKGSGDEEVGLEVLDKKSYIEKYHPITAAAIEHNVKSKEGGGSDIMDGLTAAEKQFVIMTQKTRVYVPKGDSRREDTIGAEIKRT
jgi:hypothetical protein